MKESCDRIGSAASKAGEPCSVSSPTARAMPWVKPARTSGRVELRLDAVRATVFSHRNLWHRLVDGKPVDAPPVKPPGALTLTTEPQANVERYDALRKAREMRHGS